jgi:hypothetical protein
MKAVLLGVVCWSLFGCTNAPPPSGHSGEYYVVGKVARWTWEGEAGYSIKILDPLSSGYYVGQEMQIAGPATTFRFTGRDLGPLEGREWSSSLLLRMSKTGQVTTVENLGLADEKFERIRALRNR